MIEYRHLSARAVGPLAKGQHVYVSSKGAAHRVYRQLTGLPKNSVVGKTLEPIAKGAVGWFNILIRDADDLRRLKAMPPMG